jgi:hypothetical protein
LMGVLRCVGLGWPTAKGNVSGLIEFSVSGTVTWLTARADRGRVDVQTEEGVG